MGRQDPARQNAIAAELSEAQATVGEDIVDATQWSLDEESRANEEERELLREAERTLDSLKQSGRTPQEWWNDLLYAGAWEARVRDAMIDIVREDAFKAECDRLVTEDLSRFDTPYALYRPTDNMDGL